jgi:2-dehydro-3-deoxyphosphogluconate aldolase/(4S)-4-hydroxy-2-oxoglutarate aldolase
MDIANRFNKKEVLELLDKTQMIAVVRTNEPKEALKLGEIAVKSGVFVVEITATVPSYDKVVTQLRDTFGNSAVVGVGSILNTGQLETALDAGAQFVVTPAVVKDITISHYLTKSIFIIGALTPSEILHAEDIGADLVKVFPVNAVGGISYIRSILEPMPWLKLVPTGGVNLDNFVAFIDAGATCVGLGSALFPKQLLLEEKWEAMSQHIAKFVVRLAEARDSSDV